MIYKQNKKANSAPEQGNALFFLLIAIALLGALSVAILPNTSNTSITSETRALQASAIMQYSTRLKDAVQGLRIVNGCTDTEISFHYDSDEDGLLETNGNDLYYNPTSPTDFSCHVFHPDGGGLNWIEPNPNYFDTSQSSEHFHGEFLLSGMPYVLGIPTPDIVPDLTFIVPYISLNLCTKINQSLGLNASSNFAPAPNNGFAYLENDTFYFTGIYGQTLRVIRINGAQTASTGCFEGSTPSIPETGTYHFVHTLIQR